MRVFLEKNVFDATIDRIGFIYEEFDDVIVWVSGGKDSTVIFNLSKQVAKSKGKDHINVAWIDQEAEWKTTEEWSKTVMYDDFVKPYWFQIPMKLSNATCTRQDFLECWNEKERELWIREKDKISIKENKYGTDRFHELFDAITDVEWGDIKLASVTGIRAEESPGRWAGLTSSETYRGITWGRKSKVNKNHIALHPLYDWGFTDVWKAIHSNRWYYNKMYDYFFGYGLPVNKMRISNLHHETAVWDLFRMQELEPDTYNKLCKRLEGIHSASHFGIDDYFVNELPYMFKDWKEYRNYLLSKLIKEEHQGNMREIFRKHDIEFEDKTCYTKILKSHVNAILANDWDECVKIKNAHIRFSTPTSRRERKEKELLLSKN